jgi:hypothetical protein
MIDMGMVGEDVHNLVCRTRSEPKLSEVSAIRTHLGCSPGKHNAAPNGALSEPVVASRAAVGQLGEERIVRGQLGIAIGVGPPVQSAGLAGIGA